jgi:hypothetical protein
MSTIKSSAENLTLNADGANNDIIFQSNGSNVATLDQAGLLTATTFAGSGASLTGVRDTTGGRKNIIINGGMSIAQRGTSTTSGAQVYLLDRFYTYSFAATNRTVTQSTDSPDEFSHSLKVQRTASDTATTALYLSQPIETKQCVGTAGKKVTLSFWAKAGANWSDSGGTIGVSVYSGTGTDQSLMSGLTGSSAVINTSQVLTTSWVKYSFTSAAIVPTNSTQLVYQSINGWAGTAGADDSFYITGIQLETGETATDFEHRSYGEELALCQRYYTVGSMSNTNVTGMLYCGNSVMFPQTMRATPTVTISDDEGNAGKCSADATDNVAAAVRRTTDAYVSITVTNTAIGNNVFYNQQFAATAEL